MVEPARLGVLEAAAALRAREISAAELLESVIAAIAARDLWPSAILD